MLKLWLYVGVLVSLLTLNVDLSRTAAALERIAASLERIALHAYGIAPGPAKRSAFARDTTTDEHDVTYTTNESTLRQELERLVMPGTVRERDGEVVEEEVGGEG